MKNSGKFMLRSGPVLQSFTFFSYYGNDKISFLYELYWRGFDYWVIPDHFIVHYPHKRSAWAKEQTKDAKIAELLMKHFKYNLKNKCS
jgi:hypothetical protein